MQYDNLDTFPGRVAEAQRELGQMKDNRDVGLAVVLALIHAHKQSVSVDRDAVKELEVCTAAASGCRLTRR